MQISPTQIPAPQLEADAVVVGMESGKELTGPAQQVDVATGGAITKLIERGEITGKKYELISLLAPAGVKATHVLIVGLGSPGEAGLDRGTAYRAAAAAAKRLGGKQRQKVGYYLGHDWSPELTESGICGAIVGTQNQDLYRAEKNRFEFDELLWNGGTFSAIESGTILGESMNLTRRLVNEPPQNMYPESFAEAAAGVASEYGLKIEVWDQAQLEAERCGSLLAVARGSDRPPRLVILRHNGGKPGAPTLAIVGKGVTFDSGGLSLKPTDGMLTMKCDMAGAATMLGAMQAIARLKLPINVIGFAGLVENMVSGSSYKLGDVLTARNGRTIEVHNTDAEGRLVLADVLSVAVDQGVAKIIDLATLTGAACVALGLDVTAVMTNDQGFCDELLAAAQLNGEPAWQLPMFPEYRDQIKGEVADIKNVGEGRWGGAITAAKFLEEFVAGKPWVHFDIAGPAFVEKPKAWNDGGGSGAMLRTLVEIARKWK